MSNIKKPRQQIVITAVDYNTNKRYWFKKMWYVEDMRPLVNLGLDSYYFYFKDKIDADNLYKELTI